MSNEMLDSYKAYVQSQCSFYSPDNPEFLSGEIIFQWFNRKSLQREMSGQQAELSRMDGVLSGLMYEQKKRLSRLGRNGGWSAWLKQHKIPRSTADRLALEHVEFFGLQHELPHRNIAEPLEGNICQAAYRVSERVENMLRSPKARMAFVRCLSDLFGLAVDYEGDAVRLSYSPPVDVNDWKKHPVPNVIEMQNDGTPRPVNYELRDEQDGSPLWD